MRTRDRSTIPRRRGRFDHRDDDHRWKLSLLREFIRKRGWKALRAGVVVPPGVKLENWVRSRRRAYKTDKIKPWLEKALEAIPGWSWDPIGDAHDARLQQLRAHVRRHGWVALPEDLHEWVARIRVRLRRNRDERPRLARALERVPGWSWNPVGERVQRKLNALRDYLKKHDWSELTPGTVWKGHPIGIWVRDCKGNRVSGDLSAQLARELEAIPGWSWTPPPAARMARRLERYRQRVRLLAEFVVRHGWRALQLGTGKRTVYRGFRLGDWVTEQRRAMRNGRLPRELAAELEKVRGWQWDPQKEVHDAKLELLRRYLALDRRNTVDELFKWRFFIQSRWAEHQRGEMPRDTAHALEAVPGWTWGSSTLVKVKSRRSFASDLRFFTVFMARQRGKLDLRGVVVLYDWLGYLRTARGKAAMPTWLAGEIARLTGWREMQ